MYIHHAIHMIIEYLRQLFEDDCRSEEWYQEGREQDRRKA